VARAREEALRRRNEGDFHGAESMLRIISSELAASSYATPALVEQSEDLNALADQIRSNSFSVMEEKYMAQRAYNAHRGKHLYEEKLRRKRPRP
jgi:hypothetical protein